MGFGMATGSLSLSTVSVLHPHIYWFGVHTSQNANLCCYHQWLLSALAFVTDSTISWFFPDFVPRMVDKLCVRRIPNYIPGWPLLSLADGDGISHEMICCNQMGRHNEASGKMLHHTTDKCLQYS